MIIILKHLVENDSFRHSRKSENAEVLLKNMGELAIDSVVKDSLITAADDHARQEYDRFEALRREYKEALGEAESIKALKAAAKQFGRGQKKLGGGE